MWQSFFLTTVFLAKFFLLAAVATLFWYAAANLLFFVLWFNSKFLNFFDHFFLAKAFFVNCYSKYCRFLINVCNFFFLFLPL